MPILCNRQQAAIFYGLVWCSLTLLVGFRVLNVVLEVLCNFHHFAVTIFYFTEPQLDGFGFIFPDVDFLLPFLLTFCFAEPLRSFGLLDNFLEIAS